MTRHVGFVVFALIAAACHDTEPMAGGRPLSFWKKEATKVSLLTFWNSDRDERRRVAFRRLTEIGGPAVPVLVDLMRSHRAPVNGDAFNALANLGPRASSAVPELIEMLNGDEVKVRRDAAWLLGTIGPAAASAVPSLTPLLRHPDERMREVAARALGQIGGSGRLALERAMTSDDGLPRNGASPRLLAAVLSGGDASARAEAAWRLGSEAGERPYATAARGDPAVVSALLAALNDRDARVRIYAARALAYGEGAPKEKGIQRLRRDMHTVEAILAVRAARALWDVSHDLTEVTAAYRAGLADSARWNRVETISAVADLGENANVFATQLEQLMNDPAPEVRDRAGKIMYVIRARRTR